MAKITLYCINDKSSKTLEGYFEDYEKFKEFFERSKSDYPNIKENFMPVKIVIDTDYDWKNNLIADGKCPSIFPQQEILIELL